MDFSGSCPATSSPNLPEIWPFAGLGSGVVVGGVSWFARFVNLVCCSTSASSFRIRSSNSALSLSSAGEPLCVSCSSSHEMPRDTQLEQGASRLQRSFRVLQNLQETGR